MKKIIPITLALIAAAGASKAETNDLESLASTNDYSAVQSTNQVETTNSTGGYFTTVETYKNEKPEAEKYEAPKKIAVFKSSLQEKSDSQDLEITGIRKLDGSNGIKWKSELLKEYKAQTSEDLEIWTDVPGTFIGTGGYLEFVDSDNSSDQKYYRILTTSNNQPE